MTTKLILSEDLFESTIEKSGKDLYITGIFAQSEVVNGNRRIYKDVVMEREVLKYNDDFISKNRALGELNHPADRITVDPSLASHLIVEMVKDGNNYIGKAKILNTPQGQIVRGLLEGGVQMGVSTRGVGSVKKNSNGISEVQSDFSLKTVDVVLTPSAPDAFVGSIVESNLIENIFDGLTLEEEFSEFLKQRKKIKSCKTKDERLHESISLYKRILQSLNSY